MVETAVVIAAETAAESMASVESEVTADPILTARAMAAAAEPMVTAESVATQSLKVIPLASD